MRDPWCVHKLLIVEVVTRVQAFIVWSYRVGHKRFCRNEWATCTDCRREYNGSFVKNTCHLKPLSFVHNTAMKQQYIATVEFTNREQ